MKNIKPSELILLALKNLEITEKMPETYKIDMNSFHTRINNKCFICLAGAVMAITLHLDPNRTIDVFGLVDHRDLLYALNQFRVGSIKRGLKYMNIELPNLKSYMPVTSYFISPSNFKKDLKSIANYLKENNL